MLVNLDTIIQCQVHNYFNKCMNREGSLDTKRKNSGELVEHVWDHLRHLSQTMESLTLGKHFWQERVGKNPYGSSSKFTYKINI